MRINEKLHELCPKRPSTRRVEDEPPSLHRPDPVTHNVEAVKREKHVLKKFPLFSELPTPTNQSNPTSPTHSKKIQRRIKLALPALPFPLLFSSLISQHRVL